MSWRQFRLKVKTQWAPLLTAYFFSLIPAVVLFSITMVCFGVNEHLGLRRRSDSLWLAFDSILSVCVVAAAFRIRRALSAVQGTEQRYRIAVECAPDGILISDKAGVLLEANAAACQLLGRSRADVLELPLLDLASKHKCWSLPEAFRATLAGETVTRECPLRQADGTALIAEATGSVLGDGRVMMILRDVSVRRQILDALRESEERYRVLAETANDGILTLNTRGEILFANRAAEIIFGYDHEEFIGQDIAALVPEHLRNRHRSAFARHVEALGGQPVHHRLEVDGLHRSGRLIPLEVAFAECVLHGERLLTGFLRDVSERRQAEEQLKASLAEKDVLLKEVHHRVKNNLQIISSLLTLQSQKIQDLELLTTFRETENRVRSIALLHEELYRSADLARIDFPRYLQAVVGHLASAYSFPAFRIRLTVKASPLTLDLATAVPCALIVNELVSNALRHAFPDGQGGEIYVLLDSSADRRVTLTVGDTGVGLPPDAGLKGGGTLGLQLLATLVRQLRGTVEQCPAKGAEFRISFQNPN